jgi:pyruvate kinase
LTTEARPTRAEVNDAANAVADGADAIMLSGETAVGAHPAKTVQTLDAIIRDAESSPEPTISMRRDDRIHDDHTQAICEAAVTLADRSNARAIVAVTRGGSTARRLSALRPRAPIAAATELAATARRLALHWGIVPLCMDLGQNLDAASVRAGRQLVALGLVEAGAVVVFVSVNADLTRSDANYLKIQRL